MLGHRPLCVYNEDVGTTIDSYNGQRHCGCIRLSSKRVFWDGSLMRDHFSEQDLATLSVLV